MADHNNLGKKGENLAAGFLEAKGYSILDKNYRFKKSEIDLVAFRMEPPELVFVEVKSRTHLAFGLPEEAVTDEKKQLIYLAADAYIYEKRMNTIPTRFDIVAISFEDPHHPLIHHVEDAFRPSSFWY